jgi:hypothetical protein
MEGQVLAATCHITNTLLHHDLSISGAITLLCANEATPVLLIGREHG